MAHEQRVSGDLFSRTRLQWFLSDPLHFFYKKLIILTPRIVQALHMMSIEKAVPKVSRTVSAKVCSMRTPSGTVCTRKGSHQETVSLLKSNQSLEMTIRADAEFCLPIWHCRMREAFLMHVSSALDAIEYWGTFKACKEAHEVYVEQCEVLKQLKADMSLFTTPTSESEKANEKRTEQASNKTSGKNRSLRKRRLLRRPKKARLCPTHQLQNFAKNTRPSTRKPYLQKRLPKARKKPLRPRCFSFTQTCCLRMQSTRGTR
jgi:hypothetical protein